MQRLYIGHGFDVHAFGSGKPLLICGVCIPSNIGLQAYSDGDVALHALIDAIIGGLSMRDIGKIFPNTMPKFINFNSRSFLRTIFKIMNSQNFTIEHIDMSIVA